MLIVKIATNIGKSKEEIKNHKESQFHHLGLPLWELWDPSRRLWNWCHTRPRRAILRMQADLPTMVPATDLETASYLQGVNYSPIWLGPVTSTTHQGTLEESCIHMCQVIGILNSVLAMGPEVAQEPAPAPPSHGLWAPGGKPTTLSQTLGSERAL